MQTNSVWYDKPAGRWKECFPMGNGCMGAMVYGGVSEETLCLNEESIWDKPFDDYGNPKAVENLPKLRQLLFEGKLAEAQALANECFVSIPRKFGAFLPFGDLVILESDVTFADSDLTLKSCDYDNYKRSLDLEQGIVRVDYEKQGVKFHREYFVSHVDNVIAIRYWHESKSPMDYLVFFQKGRDNCCICSEDDESMVVYEDQLCNNGIKYCGVAKGVAATGSAKTDMWPWKMGYADPYLQMSKTNDFVVYVAITTDYQDGDPYRCYEYVKKACAKGYEQIKADHIKDFSGLYNRFKFELEDYRVEDISLPKWLDQVRAGDVTPAFTELYMNFTRYMMISSSRKGTLPSNLQGIWNDKMHPGCESDYHTNINYQINYWTTQAWGLSDCEEPLVRWLEDLLPGGREAALKTYGARGWTVHHCSDIFGYAWPNFDQVGLWPMGGPWMCRHLYERWLYNRDYSEMRHRLYPIIRECVEFLLDFLVEAPENSACPGCLVTNPSVSPENEYILENGEYGMLTYASTMDIQMIQDVFGFTLEMINEIQKYEDRFDQTLVEEMKLALTRLPEVKISPSHGGIQEWIEDYKEKDQGHRHVSQLYGVYPGKTISDEKTPDLAKAARRSLERKYEAGYDGQGWSLSWFGNIWARLGNANKAWSSVEEAYRRHLLPNLMINAHGMPQVGDAFGLPAAVLEMLVQSHEDKIVLLPSVPQTLASGSVRGLRVRGKHVVDMTWKNQKLIEATIWHEEGCVEMPVCVADEQAYEIVSDEKKTVIRRC